MTNSIQGSRRFRDGIDAFSLACTSGARLMAADTDVEYACDGSSVFLRRTRMRSNILCLFVSVFAAFTQFAAVFVAFALPIPATADQPAGAVATISITQEHSVLGVPEVIVEVRRAI